jgi:hypothetical protein
MSISPTVPMSNRSQRCRMAWRAPLEGFDASLDLWRRELVAVVSIIVSASRPRPRCSPFGASLP